MGESMNNILMQTNLVPTSFLWGQTGYSEGTIMSEIADVGLEIHMKRFIHVINI